MIKDIIFWSFAADINTDALVQQLPTSTHFSFSRLSPASPEVQSLLRQNTPCTHYSTRTKQLL